MATLEEERYLRNLLLFGEGGIFLLRHLVVHEDRKSRITLEAQLLRNRNLFSNILKEQYQILYPSPLTANVDLKTWDLSILLLVVKKLFSQGLPHPVVADIGALKAYRNSLQGHPNSMSLTASDYKSNRQRVKNILRSIASYVHQTVPIEDLITRTKSDSIDIRSVIRQVKETQAFSNSIQSILDDKLQQINQNLASMGTDLKSTKDKVDAIEKNQKEGHEEIKKSLATLKDSVDSSKQNQEESHNELKERLQFIQECSGDSQLTLDKVLEELRRLRRDVRKNQSSQVQKAKHDFTKELDTIIQAECENEKKQKEATDLLFDFVQIIQSNKKYDDGEIKLLIAQRVEWYGEKLTLELINDMIKLFSDVYDHCDGTGDARIGSIHLPIFCSSVKGLLTLLCYINSNQCKQHLSSISSTVSKIFVSSCSLSWKVDSTSLQSAMTSFLDNIGPESSTKNLKKLILPFYATDIKQLTNIWKLFGEENRSIHLENISRTLSKIFEETILLRTSVDKNQLLEAVKQTESSELAKEECEGIKRKLSNIEILVFEQKEEIKRLRLEDSDEQKQQAYEKAKLEWRNKMIKEYHKTVLKVPAMPLLPDETCEFNQIYVRPTIVTEVKDEKGETKEKVIESMSEIFTKNGVPLKSIYVVGDAGTGKSSFCKYLVNCWCMAHNAGQIVEDKFDGVYEMKKFEFLFLISLRHNQIKDSIHEMLKNQYNIDILGTLLEKESAKIIILLDGLDEWSPKGKTFSQFQTMGLPQHDGFKDYTIVTTSRPWKIHTLRIRDTEIQQMLKLRGFDDDSEGEMVKRTVSQYNTSRNASKIASQCKEMLEKKSVENLKQIPVMLQQVICLWLDGKLDKTTRCAIYTGMLELFFTWNENKSAGKNTLSPMKVDLPKYLAKKRECRSYSHIIYDMSQLAYETLFKRTKDESLAFDIDVFDYLHISDETRERCLKLGILTENKCPSLCVSEPPGSIFSFIHKLVQEFLAAVNIAINFEIKMKSSAREDIEDTCTKFVKGVLQNCSTVNEVLEQSNVVIMLCGVEPRLAAHVSKYIYDIVKEDPMVQIYRRTIDSDFIYSDYPCIREIQTLIVDSIKECNSCPVESKHSFCIGDLYIYDSSGHGLIFLDYKENCDIVCSSIDQQQIIPDFIHSIFVNNINTKNFRFSEYLPNFRHLEKIIIYTDQQGSSSTENVEDWRIDEVNQSVVETIEINVKSLKSLSLNLLYSTDIVTSLYKEVVCILPRMINLVAIKMTDVTTSHDDTTRLCEFLEGTSQLEQIHIDIKCECRNQLVVDLSKHQQLQYLDLSCSTCICVTDIDTENLEIFKFWKIKSTNYIKIFDCFMKCDKLKELELCVDYNNESQSFHTSITKRLVSVLLLLHNLSKLNLHRFRLTDNIIQVPSEMKSLKSIDLRIVTMSLTTWRNFVDSLPNIPHTVDVELCFCHITRDDEEFKVDKLSFVVGERVVEGVAVGGEKGNEARQYVKDRKHLFIVRHDDVSWFTFSTRK